jgi:hypothetical protein
MDEIRCYCFQYEYLIEGVNNEYKSHESTRKGIILMIKLKELAYVNL